MTAKLPARVQEIFHRFITCELTTVGIRQQPITWPVTPYYELGGETIDVTTGLGYPKKADDAIRHPSVSLLFSDPTGAVMERPPMVLVQGTARVDDRNLAENRERYARESVAKLPATKDMHPPKLVRTLFSWYYTRIYVHIRPERVFIWPAGEVDREPQIQDSHMEEVRSGHSEEPIEPHEDTAAGEPIWDARLDRLGSEHETAVVSWLAPDGFPLAVRIPIRPDAASRSVALLAEPAGIPLLEGRGCLTAHRHAADFTWQTNFQVRGRLVHDGDGWRLVPRKLVGGFEVPASAAGRYRAFLSRAIPYYRRAQRRRKGISPAP